MDLGELKVETLQRARMRAIPVSLPGKATVVTLVPVGPWILRDSDLIRAISEWRARSMPSFLIRFDSTPSKTERYLRDFSLGQYGRLLFMIEVDGVFVGHIGLANISEKTAEVDNVMRGVVGGYPGLMEASGRALIAWSFNKLGLEGLYLQVLSDNLRAKSLYGRLGFMTAERHPLRIEHRYDSTALVRCPKEEATVDFTSDIMTLDRVDFEKILLGSGLQ